MNGELRTVDVTAFLEPDTTIEIHPPRDFIPQYDDGPRRTGWIVQLGTGSALRLHVRDAADLRRLHAALGDALTR